MAENPYRALPSVDRVVAHESLRALREQSPEMTVRLARRALETARNAVADGQGARDENEIAAQVADLAQAAVEPSLRPVINATGVILHTNLGRAPLSMAARESMDAVAWGYSNLEFDLDAGERGSRQTHLQETICRVTGAESAVVMNNNAAAVLLALTAIAREREVVVSRGQAVEIGGGFRIPDVLRQSGATLVEVGTTNRTNKRDYESAVGPETAAILRVHASNFKVVGFTHEASLADMVRVAREHAIPLIDDVGSGCLIDVTQFGLAPEPTVQESVAAGADLCLFSGDKLLGGPQAGIIVGLAELVERLECHPLARALRPDKATLAALHATLLHYLKGEALTEVPVWRMISMPLEQIEQRASALTKAIGEPAIVIDGRSMVGGGSLPEESLPTKLLAIAGDGAWLDGAARRLRLGSPSVVARVADGQLLLDPRTVDPEDDGAIVEALKPLLAAR